MVVAKANPYPIECVVRGYLSGSAWKDYTALKKTADQDAEIVLHGVALGPDMVESQKLPKPVFTPSTKESSGHDINISAEKAREIVGQEAGNGLPRKLRVARDHAEAGAVYGGLAEPGLSEQGDEAFAQGCAGDAQASSPGQRPDVFRSPFGDDPSLTDEAEAVAVLGLVEIVSGHQHGLANCCQPADVPLRTGGATPGPCPRWARRETERRGRG